MRVHAGEHWCHAHRCHLGQDIELDVLHEDKCQNSYIQIRVGAHVEEFVTADASFEAALDTGLALARRLIEDGQH